MSNKEHLNLDIVIVSATFLRDQGTWSKQSPYIQVRYKNQTFITEISKNTGKEAHWNQLFQIDRVEQNQTLTFTANNKNLLADDYLGEATVNLQDLVKGKQ